jgi:hypothetical protein
MRFGRPAAVTALWANQDHLDLFAVNAGGAVATIWWESSGYRPEGWALTHPETHFLPGTTVTALWANEDHLDLFAVDDQGVVRTIWWDKNEPSGYDPAGWLMIHPESKSVPGGHVTALWANDNHLDLYVVTTDQAVSSIWWEKDQGYRSDGWFGISSERDFAPGAKVAAIWVPVADVKHLDLFTIDANGVPKSIWWDAGAGGYSVAGWFAITGTPGVTFNGGAFVEAVWISSQELLLTACDITGTVRGANWTKDANWTGWFVMGTKQFACVPGAPAMTLVSPDPNHVDVFAVDPNGGVNSTFYRFWVNDTYVATGEGSGPFLERTPAVLAIQGFIPEIFSDNGDSDIDRFAAKQSYWNDWLATGLPVFWDVSPGYDAHLVFPKSVTYGNSASWRTYIEESWQQRFSGMVYNTWNGYTEGYAAMRSLEFADTVSNWAKLLFGAAR